MREGVLSFVYVCLFVCVPANFRYYCIIILTAHGGAGCLPAIVPPLRDDGWSLARYVLLILKAYNAVGNSLRCELTGYGRQAPRSTIILK